MALVKGDRHKINMLYYSGYLVTMARASAGGKWRRDMRKTDSRERDGARRGVAGSSSEAQYHLYQVFNKTKYETGACGMKSVL